MEKQNNRYAVVAIGYNRKDSIQRLLKSLECSEYGSDNVTLIISIDNSGTDDVEKCADDFMWSHGEKKVVTYPERQGLRKHILKCGDFLREFDALAVFEDDIVAAPGFYQFMKEVVPMYQNDDRVAGISLYNHLWNVNVSFPFEAAYSQYDTYFLQFAQSWGQIWMKKQWEEFAVWYTENSEEFVEQVNIPTFVSNWEKTSWLKYHIKYCIECNKFFVYPYRSLTTCFSDVGEHCLEKDTKLQVPMLTTMQTSYRLPSLDSVDAIKYDAFFERIINDIEIDGISGSDICVNIYGSKKWFENKKYVITINKLPYRIVKSYSLELRPHEENVLQNITGKTIKMYDLASPVEDKNIEKIDEIELFRYRFRVFHQPKLVVKTAMFEIKKKILKRK